MPLLPVAETRGRPATSAPAAAAPTPAGGADPVDRAWQTAPVIPGRDPHFYRLSWDPSRSPIERHLFGAIGAGAWTIVAGRAVAWPGRRTR
ncbi:MAG: hypothetical protein RIE31_09080 [Alphaproteobacteria bacterium]